MARLGLTRAAQLGDRLLGHWLLAAAMILVAAALTMPQLDKYPLSHDAIHSYSIAHGLRGLAEGPYTPINALDNLYRSWPDQAPLYYLSLHVWGYLAGTSLAAARLISLFCGLLSLAMVYRLTRDVVSPVAGGMAAFVLLCNAFYAFHYAHVRYYTLVVWLAALIVWLYLRIATRRQQPKRRDYLALILAGCALVSTHAFGFMLALTLSLYHLLAARKDRRWLHVVAAAVASIVLALPGLYAQLTVGIALAQGGHGPRSASLGDILSTWLVVISNGSPMLLVISLAGIAVGWRRRLPRGNPFLLLFPLLVLSIGVASEVAGVVSERQMRYLLVGMPIVAGFIAAGLFALYRLRRWLGLLALLWLATGLTFMNTADWEHLIQGRNWAYTQPPWHLLSRWMLESGEKLPLLTIKVSHKILTRFQPHHMMSHYFGQHGFAVKRFRPETTATFVAQNKLRQSGYWALHQTDNPEPAAIATFEAAMQRHGYMVCGTTQFPNATLLATYRWASLQCDTQPKATYSADEGAYLHYGARHDETRLLFSGAWQPAAEADPDTHNISFQLLDDDWRSHAQIDLPTQSLTDTHQLIFDLASLPAGGYRLMAVVYNAQTGERQAWHGNEGWIPEMRQLAEFTLSGTNQ
ncbi:MAG: glycosyltransferase family 39 protein [Chloroflexi bacterium]|nr:glycosyltransferase family 39 protein [Chloroflexota bacterium]MCY4246068.1 glycosyltransferase family 39 protein [Chloroflexota bacterium]